MTSIIAALWALVKWLGLDTRNPTSLAGPTTPDNTSYDPEQPQIGDALHNHNEPFDEQSASGDCNDDRRPTEPDPTSTEAEPSEPPKNGKPEDNAEGDTSVENTQKPGRKPLPISGRRGPRPGNPRPKQLRSPSTYPELICRKVPTSATWEVVLCADDECQLATVCFEGESLDFTDRQFRVPSLRGHLTVSRQNGQEHIIPLFETEPLIFKLRKNWVGEGRRITRITTGHFIVIAPNTWERIGHVPVEPGGCVDPTFRAHYFHRDSTASDERVDGFREWNSLSVATHIKLTGSHIYDDSNDGILFVGDAPTLEFSPEIEWARVGEEIEHGWGQNFLPAKKTLQEVLDGREGRFFLRVFNSEVRLLDSVVFRYVRDLRQIHVNTTEYAQDTALIPTSTGYPPTEVYFRDAAGSTLVPTLPVGVSQIAAPSGVIEVLPHPDADHISCCFGSGTSAVNIVLELPRIWWRLEDGRSDLGEWHDTPLVMTREEFRKHAHSNVSMLLLSKRFSTVRAGFDHELDQPYSRKIEDDHITIPLAHFVDYAQIDQRLNNDVHFNVEWAGEIVPLIVISADPVPEIILFTAEPATIFSGQEAILKWMTRNASDALVVIEPDVNANDSDGTHTVRPTETTRYTLTLTVSDTDNISRTVTVTVKSPPKLGERPTARVMSPVGGWRSGRGFSSRELQDAGLTVKEAMDRSIPVDRRRRTSHQANVEAIRSMLDG